MESSEKHRSQTVWVILTIAFLGVVGILFIGAGVYLVLSFYAPETLSDLFQGGDAQGTANAMKLEENTVFEPDFDIDRFEADRLPPEPSRKSEEILSNAKDMLLTLPMMPPETVEKEWEIHEPETSNHVLDLVEGSSSLVELDVSNAPARLISEPCPAWLKYATKYRGREEDPFDTTWKPPVVFSPDNKRLYLVDFSQTLHVYNILEMREISTLELPPGDCVSIQCTADHLILLDALNRAMLFFDAATLRAVKSIALPASYDHMVIGPNDGVAYLAGEQSFAVFDLAEQKFVYVLDEALLQESPFFDDSQEDLHHPLERLVSMRVDPEGRFLYTLNRRIHKIRIDGFDLIYEQSSPEIVAAMLGFPCSLTVSADGRWIGTIDLAHDPRNSSPSLLYSRSESSGYYFYVFDTRDLSKRNAGLRHPDYPLRDAVFISSHKKNMIRLIGYRGEVTRIPWETYQRSLHKIYMFSRYSHPKDITFLRHLEVSPNELAGVLWGVHHIYFTNWNDNDLIDRLSSREEGTAYLSPRDEYKKGLARMVEEDPGWKQPPFKEYPMLYRGKMRHVARLVNVPASRFLISSRDHDSLIVHDGTVHATEYNLQFEVIDRFHLPKPFWKADQATIYAGNFNKDPEDDLFYFADWANRRRVVGRSKDGSLAISTEHDKGKPILNALRGTGTPYNVDLDGDGIDEICILMNYYQRGDEKKVRVGKFVLLNQFGHVQPSAEKVYRYPDFKYGDTDGDGRPNLYIMQYEAKYNLHEIDKKGEFIRQLHCPNVDANCFQIAHSPKREKAVFVGARDEGDSLDKMNITAAVFDEFGEPLWEFPFEDASVKKVLGDPSSPYFILNSSKGVNWIFHADREEIMGEFFCYQGATKVRFLHDPTTDEDFLVFYTEGGADVFLMDPPAGENERPENDDPLVIDVTERLNE